jgi:hypothetical protein
MTTKKLLKVAIKVYCERRDDISYKKYTHDYSKREHTA